MSASGILWFFFTLLVSALLWVAQVSPRQAASNLSAWAEFCGIKNPPQWLRDRATDRKVRIGAYVAFIFLAAWGGVLFDQWLGPTTLTAATVQSGGSPQLASDIKIGTDTIADVDNRAVVAGYLTTTGSGKLQVFLEYSMYRTYAILNTTPGGQNAPGLNDITKSLIMEVTDYYKGQRVNFTIIHRHKSINEWDFDLGRAVLKKKARSIYPGMNTEPGW